MSSFKETITCDLLTADDHIKITQQEQVTVNTARVLQVESIVCLTVPHQRHSLTSGDGTHRTYLGC